MDVKAAFVNAINTTEQLAITEFSTWPRLHEFKAYNRQGRQVLVQPDGYIRVQTTEADGRSSQHTFFLELDRSTETLEVLTDRCHCYRDHYRSGGFARCNGASSDRFKQFPFRVLVVCKGSQRCDNIAERLLRNASPIGSQVWLTTLQETISNPLGSIWRKPRDHQAGTSHKVSIESPARSLFGDLPTL